uniref:G_PROTEIN_RECEP_F1_2 domain-containing protein n=1 Tax=Steinernema glaseri TaxID=37863 RepID=A0A1I7ZR20_9BILA
MSSAPSQVLPQCETGPQHRDRTELLMDGPLSTAIIILGVVGNAYCIRVLFRTSINGAMVVSLVALAIWDIVLLVTSFFHYSLAADLLLLNISNGFHTRLHTIDGYTIGLNGLLTCAHTTSTWILIYVTAQRFFAVARPLSFTRTRFSFKKQKRRYSYVRSAALAIRIPVFITIASVIITLPSSFEYTVSRCVDVATGLQYKQIDQTDLLKATSYHVLYRMLILTVLKTFGPFVIITALTVCTLRSMRQSMARRAQILLEQGRECLFANDRDKTKSLQMISMLLLGKFLILRCWPTALEVLEALVDDNMPFLSRIGHMLVLLNSATNSTVFVVIKSAFESHRLRRARERQRQLVAQHADQVLMIGKALAGDSFFSQLASARKCQRQASKESKQSASSSNNTRGTSSESSSVC